MLTILASFAQEESKSIADNVRWAIQKKREKGQPHCHFNIYGFRWENDELVPVPEEACIIKQIFELYLDGRNKAEIARMLNAKNLITRTGHPWTDADVRRILANIIYCGNMLLQKRFSTESFPKRNIRNMGQKPQYLIEGSHESIVDRNVWDKVQEENRKRREKGSCHPTLFTSKIRCGECGCTYHRKLRRSPTTSYWFWTCTGKEVKHSCIGSINVKEYLIRNACAYVLGTDISDDEIEASVKTITIVGTDTLKFLFRNGVQRTIHWQLGERSRKPSRTPFAVVCGCCGARFRTRYYKVADGTRKKTWNCSRGCGNKPVRDCDIIRYQSPVVSEMHINPDSIDVHLRDGRIESHMREEIICQE